jgi:hypothetical protein
VKPQRVSRRGPAVLVVLVVPVVPPGVARAACLLFAARGGRDVCGAAFTFGRFARRFASDASPLAKAGEVRCTERRLRVIFFFLTGACARISV